MLYVKLDDSAFILKVVKFGQKIVLSAQQTSETADMQCMKKISQIIQTHI